MRKNFGAKAWVYPMPVLIVAAYDKTGVPCCYVLGEKVGNAFSDGKKI